MAFTTRVNELPPLSDLATGSRVVIVDQTGPDSFTGLAPGSACVVAEFVKGPFSPIELSSPGDLAAIFGARVYPYFSQSAAGVQDGSQVAWNGNGILELRGLTFARLTIQRVDTEAVTTDGGSTKGVLSITVTVDAADQVAGALGKDLRIPAGTRFGDSATPTIVFATSEDVIVPAGTVLTSNACSVTAHAFAVKVVEPVVATAAGAVDTVLEPALENVATGTTITGVTNGTNLWPPGTGTTLAGRIESRYSAAIDKTVPGNPITDDITVAWCARRSQGIRQALATSGRTISASGRGRMVVVNADPAAGTDALAAANARTAAIGLAAADGYVQPADGVVIAFPHHRFVVEDLGNVSVTVGSASLMACTLNRMPEEWNPGQENPYIQRVASLEDAFVASPPGFEACRALEIGGVCTLIHDKAVGWWFFNGVTAAAQPTFRTRRTIKRKRVAFMVQDGLNAIAAPYLKKPATTENVQTFVASCQSFLGSLLSKDRPSLQRIADFSIDPVSGNTSDLTALGIFTLQVKVRVLNTMDTIVLKTEIGETVVITDVTAAA